MVNIALLNQSTVPLNVSNHYTQLVYQQDSNFNPIQSVFFKPGKQNISTDTRPPKSLDTSSISVFSLFSIL